jgi:hypothetical protein
VNPKKTTMENKILLQFPTNRKSFKYVSFGSHTVTVKCGTVDYLTESLTVKMGGSYNLYIYDKVNKQKTKVKA